MRNILAVTFLLFSSAAWGQPVVGSVGALTGTATVAMAGAAPVPLLAHQDLREGSVVQTGPDSRLRLALADGTNLTLGPESALRLEHLAQVDDPSPSRFAHLFGYLRAAVARQRGHAGLEISTDSEVAAVRGTVWVQHAEPGSTDVYVAVGRVAVRGGGGTVVLAHGQGVTYRAGAAHSPVQHWTDAKIAVFDAATRLP